MTSYPLVSRTFATLRSAEFGFFGVVVYTRVHTPRRCGQASRAGTLLLLFRRLRPLATNWLIVGIKLFCLSTQNGNFRRGGNLELFIIAIQIGEMHPAFRPAGQPSAVQIRSRRICHAVGADVGDSVASLATGNPPSQPSGSAF